MEALSLQSQISGRGPAFSLLFCIKTATSVAHSPPKESSTRVEVARLFEAALLAMAAARDWLVATLIVEGFGWIIPSHAAKKLNSMRD